MACVAVLVAGWTLVAPPARGQVEVISQTCQALALEALVACELVVASEAGAAVTLSYEVPGGAALPAPGHIMGTGDVQPQSIDISIYNDNIYTMDSQYISYFDYDLIRRGGLFCSKDGISKW